MTIAVHSDCPGERNLVSRSYSCTSDSVSILFTTTLRLRRSDHTRYIAFLSVVLQDSLTELGHIVISSVRGKKIILFLRSLLWKLNDGIEMYWWCNVLITFSFSCFSVLWFLIMILQWTRIPILVYTLFACFLFWYHCSCMGGWKSFLLWVGEKRGGEGKTCWVFS